MGLAHMQIPFASGTSIDYEYVETMDQNDNGWFSIVQGKLIPGTEMDHNVIGFPDPNASGTVPDEIPCLSFYQKINKTAAVYTSYKLELQIKFEYGFLIPLGNFYSVNDGASQYDEAAALHWWFENWIEGVGKRCLLYKYIDPDDGFEKVAELAYVRDNVPSVTGADVYGIVGPHINLFYREPLDPELPDGDKQWRSHTVPFLPVEGSWSTPGSGGEVLVDEDDPEMGIVTDFKQLTMDQQLEAIYYDCISIPTTTWNSYNNDPNHGLSGWQFVGQYTGAYMRESHHIRVQAQMGSDFNVWRHFYAFAGDNESFTTGLIFDEDLFPRDDVNDDNEVLLRRMNDLYTYDYLMDVVFLQ